MIDSVQCSFSLCLSEGSGGGGLSGGGVSRPLGSDDLRLIEEDLSKQLNTEMYDRDLELDSEPYISTMVNGGEDSQYFVEFIIDD